MSQPEPSAGGPGHGKLGVWDTICIIVAIVIGSSIFKTPWLIFGNTTTPWVGMGVWVLGGILTIIGALCYAELGSTYPRAGGDYVYLTRAFGRPVGFLFGWAQLVVILSGSTGAMAFVFGDYFVQLLEIGAENKTFVVVSAAVGAVLAMAVVNFFGVVLGKRFLDGLVLIKLAGFGLIIYAGFAYAHPAPFEVAKPIELEPHQNFGIALILVLYAFGGWNDVAFVAADLKKPRNIISALIWGTVLVTVLYLLVNLAYIMSYGYVNIRSFNPAVATGVLAKMDGSAAKIIAVLVMISALGAINGLLFTGSRVYASLGSEHTIFSALGKWHPRWKTPIRAILVQAFIAIFMILQVGTEQGKKWTNEVLEKIGSPTIPFDRFFNDGFDTLFAGTASVFWVFFLLTGLSLFVLRAKDPNIERPFKLGAPWYPLLPIIFCATSIFGIYAAVSYATWVSLIGWVPLALGVPLYFLSGHTPKQDISGQDIPS